MWRRSGVLVLFVLIAAAAAGQSLGELAQKEKKRREKNKEQGVKVHVVAEKEISTAEPETSELETSSVPTSEEALPSSSEEQGSAGPPSQGPSTDPKKAEAEWRGRMREARARLESARKRHETLSSLHLSTGEYYVDEEGRPVITSLEQLRRMVNEAESELNAATEALENLEEEARRAGVPPGWIRD